MRGVISTNNFTSTDGKLNWFAIIFVLVIVIAAIYQIVESHYTIKKMTLAEIDQQLKMKELENNLRNAMAQSNIPYVASA